MYRQDYWTCLTQTLLQSASLFTASEHVIQEHVTKYKNGAAALKDLIQQVIPDSTRN